jgi:DNA-binding response OmpR family regulator
MHKILIIVEMADLAETLKDILEFSGYKVIISDCLKDEGSINSIEMPDLVICDEDNNEIKDLLITLRKKYLNTPVILLTGWIDLNRIPSSLYQVVITKPFQLETLLAQVRILIG